MPAASSLTMLFSCLFCVSATLASVASAWHTAAWPPPPSWKQKAKMARYLAHYADWGIVSAISPDNGYVPFGTLQSFADGPVDVSQSSGTPYLYLASVSTTFKNIAYNNTVSLTVSQAESSFCLDKHWDPEEPLCARLTMTGQVLKVQDRKERNFSKMSLFSRHPAMKQWPHDHGWDFYKLRLTGVCLLDFYGGATHVPLKDYFTAKP